MERGSRHRGQRSRGRRGGSRGNFEGGRGSERERHRGWMTLDEGRARVNQILASLQLSSEKIVKMEDLEKGKFAPRPDSGGKAGTRHNITTNVYGLVCGCPNIYHYDIDIRQHGKHVEKEERSIDPGVDLTERLPTKLNRAILSGCSDQNHWNALWAFDGRKTLYSPRKLFRKDVNNFLVDMSEKDKERKFTVKISLVSVLEVGNVQRFLQRGDIKIPQKIMTTMETCLKASFKSDPDCVCFSRSFFFRDQKNILALPEGAELWKGHFQSVRLTEQGLALNVDLTHAPFIKEQSLLDYLLVLTNFKKPKDLTRLRNEDWGSIGNELKGFMIMTNHLKVGNKKHRFDCFTRKSAENSTFKFKDGTVLSVADHWSNNYGDLKFPRLPCVDVSRGKKPIYLPLEACKITSGQRKMFASGDQTKDIIRNSARKPADRIGGIRDSLKRSKFNSNPILDAFGIKVEDQEIKTEARNLPNPFLQYRKPECFNPGNAGSWNLEDIELYKPGTLDSWSIISFAHNTQEFIKGELGLMKIIIDLREVMKKMGLTVHETFPPFTEAENVTPKNALIDAARKAINSFKKPPKVILVVLPNRDSARYKEIKRVAEGELGLMTQCFVATSAGIGTQMRGRIQFLSNLTLKINQKIGGKNCKLVGSLGEMFPTLGSKKNRPFIIFGADVTHPRTFDVNEPSVGAVVASMDSELSEFCTRVVYLPHRQELMDMRVAIKELLLCFFKKNRIRPEAVFYYRDGVSDGQFEAVLQHEYNEFHEAFALLDANYKPPITFVVVKKRHHFRMFPQLEFGDRNGNPLPGTVIDRGITSKYDFDFYLNSQSGVQGTNKPAHYYALLDENGFGSDGLQLFTYWFCYLFCRCTNSVSYAPPAYYAHHAAEHGKHLTSGRRENLEAEGEEEPKRPTFHAALQDRMFFI